VKSAILIYENPALAARYALENVGGAVTPDAIRKEVAQLATFRDDIIGDPSIARMGYTPIGGIARYCKYFNDLGLTSALVPAQEIVTNQFVAYANDFDKKAWIAEVKRMR
jgi:hypothetical protein